MDQNWNFHNRYINRTLEPETDYYISMGIIPDITLGYRGVELDQIDVFHESGLFSVLAS